jgi:hypothetical protein
MAGTAQGRSICAFDIIGQNAIKERPRNDDSLSFFFENISVVLVTSDIPLKPLLIQRHKPSKKSDGVFGFHNIELELAEFNREFHVSAPDRRWAFDVLTQPVMEFLLASPRFCLEFDDCHVIAYRGGAFTTEDFEAALAVIAGVLDRIPRCVVE